MSTMSDWVDQIEQALLAVDAAVVRLLVERAGAAMTPIEFVDAVIVPALERIGLRWERGEAALSQVYMSGRIIESLLNGLFPAGRRPRKQSITLAVAVLEDYHFLGKNLVLSILRAAGFDLMDLGRVEIDALVERVRSDHIGVLLISVLMLPAALRVRELRERLADEGVDVKIVVGGAPFRFDPELWREVGADACGQSAGEALQIVRSLLMPPATGEA
ncbi:MAG: cobalamin B12-binding domain-containing protein [Syntrophobacteraceae bacterium]